MANYGVEQAKQIYNVKRWSEGYFDIDSSGALCVNPVVSQQQVPINLPQLCRELKQQGLSFPILVRFTDILSHRASRLVEAFRQAKQEKGFQNVDHEKYSNPNLNH